MSTKLECLTNTFAESIGTAAMYRALRHSYRRYVVRSVVAQACHEHSVFTGIDEDYDIDGNIR
jgi:hypothetical protein